MKRRGRLFASFYAVAITATVFSPASNVSANPANYVKSPLSGALTTAQISDPSLNDMPAATLTIPAGWKLQGIMMIAPCTTIPWPVIRAYSADGLLQYRIEPVVSWRWGKRQTQSGCLGLTGAMKAADFLHYYVGTLKGGVHVVGAVPVPQAYASNAQRLASVAEQINEKMPPALVQHHTADTAALEIERFNGSFLLQERLRAEVECAQPTSPASILASTCWARVDVLSAPKGRLAKLEQIVDDNNLPHGIALPSWEQAAMARQQEQGREALAQLTALEQSESRMLYNQFAQIMARSRAEHEQFMAQQESSFRSSMANANASMAAQSTAASDWVDYSLDRQTVMNPDGSTSKVSSAYSYTWTNGTQWYQTNNPNTNPNGSLTGSWSQTAKVHGNGQAL